MSPKPRTPELTAQLVEAVKSHAMEHYEDGLGWDEIVECYTDEEIAAELGNARTPRGAIREISSLVKLRHERAEDIRGTIW